MDQPVYMVALFQSVSGAMKAETALKKESASFKIIPVPKHISSECGICIRFSSDDEAVIEKILKDNDLVFQIKRL